MENTGFRLFNSKGAALTICGILSIFGMVESASAECVVGDDDPSNFTLLIDATSSCSNMSDNMYGCDVAAGATGCTIFEKDGMGNPTGNSIDVFLDNGSVGGTEPVDWSSTGDGQVVFTIIVGANNGGSCGTSYTPGSEVGEGLGFLKKNSEIQKMNAVSFCSDFKQPASTSPVAEICPDGFQTAVNTLSVSTGLDFAFLEDPNQSGRRSICVPDGGDGSIETKRYACIDQCVTKPECLTDTSGPACSPSVCEPSGSWTTQRVEGNPDTFACTAFPTSDFTPPTDPEPYCWEIQQDLAGDCDTTVDTWQPQEESVLTIKKGHINPYVWQSCYSSGGRYVCETMCYAFTVADSTRCPLNSTILHD